MPPEVPRPAVTTDTIDIASRFRGPPGSANGGYACGRLAAYIDGPAEVSLWKPPPLEHPLQVRRENGAVNLYDGELLIGTAVTGKVRIAQMAAPTRTQARAAAERTFAAGQHPLPSCFVCGPHRRHGDGLRIHPGPLHADDLDWQGVLAAPWTPEADLADASGTVLPEFVWAALDCPTAYAVSSSEGMLSILLGRQTLQIDRLPAAGESCIVTARRFAREGRKFSADACLFGADGQALAHCNALWIEVDPAVQRGDPEP